MNILVIDQCSGRKSHPDGSKVYTADEIDSQTLQESLEQPDTAGLPARKLYAGRQQESITRAVSILRRSEHIVDRYFISAGFGLVEADQRLPPYDVTFASMNAQEIKKRSECLGISGDVRDLIANGDYDLIFCTLGNNYYRVLELPKILSTTSYTTTVVLFNREDEEERFENVISIPARTPQAKEHGTIVVALKGEYLQNFAVRLVDRGPPESQKIIVDYCTEVDTAQSGFEQYS